MLIVGTVIGAGFASGAEIVSFFGKDGISLLNAAVCTVLTFGGCVLFLVIGTRFKPKDVGGLNVLLAGKLHAPADWFLLVNSLIVTAGMLAAFETMGREVLGIPFLSLVFGMLAALAVVRGVSGLVKINTFLLPGAIVSLIVVCAMSLNSGADIGLILPKFRPLSSVVYVSMNMILAAGALIEVRGMKMSEICLSSGIAAAIIGALMTLIILALNSTHITSALPTLDMARAIGKPMMWLIVLSMAASVFTTLLTAMNSLTDYADSLIKNRKLSSFCVLAVGAVLSALGFERVVDALYPVIGVLGVVYVALAAVFFFRDSRKKRAAAKTSKRKIKKTGALG